MGRWCRREAQSMSCLHTHSHTLTHCDTHTLTHSRPPNDSTTITSHNSPHILTRSSLLVHFSISLLLAEYAFNAVKVPGLTSVAVRGDDSVIMVTQKKVPDKLLDPSSVTHMFSITDTVGACTTGLIADAKAQVHRSRAEAAQFRYQNGYASPVSMVAQRTANLAQLYTQYAFMRAYGVSK